MLVVPSSGLLITGSSDKSVKIWYFLLDPLSSLTDPASHRDLYVLLGAAADAPVALHNLASLTGHRRPPEALAFVDGVIPTILSGDSMGVIKVWQLNVEDDPRSARAPFKMDLAGHATGINEMQISAGYLWTGAPKISSTFKLMAALNESDRYYQLRRMQPSPSDDIQLPPQPRQSIRSSVSGP